MRNYKISRLPALEECLNGIYHCSKDGIIFATLDAVILDVNEAYASIVGYPRSELLSGKKYLDITSPEYNEISKQKVRELVEQGGPIEFEKVYLRKDGRRVPVLVSAFVISDSKGTPIATAAMVKDISERKRVEEKMRETERELKKRNEELESISQAKSNFVTMVTHELRTPLSAIMEGINLVWDEVDGPLTGG